MCASEASSPAAHPPSTASHDHDAATTVPTDQNNASSSPSDPSTSEPDSASDSSSDSDLPPPSVLRHLVDVHCHPTDAPELLTSAALDRLQMTVCAMSTHMEDQDRVRKLAEGYPGKVVPCFGYHPWWSHLISTSDDPDPDKETHYRRLFLPQSLPQSLSSTDGDASPQPSQTAQKPDPKSTTAKPTPASNESTFQTLLTYLPPPTPLSTILSTLRANLSQFPNAMLGEVGLDRVFRVPLQYHVPQNEKRIITPFTIPLDHQLKILKAQMLLAVELGRNVSVHSVKAQQATVGLFEEVRREVGEERWVRVSVDMHSCGLSPETWRDLEKIHPNIFLSLSTVINHNHSSLQSLIAKCAPDRILAESDFYDISRCTKQTWDMVRLIAEVKGWRVESEWDYSEDGQGDGGGGKEDGQTEGGQRVEVKESWGVVKRLEQNWFRFRDGNHPLPPQKKNRRERTLRDHVVD